MMTSYCMVQKLLLLRDNISSKDYDNYCQLAEFIGCALSAFLINYQTQMLLLMMIMMVFVFQVMYVPPSLDLSCPVDIPVDGVRVIHHNVFGVFC